MKFIDEVDLQNKRIILRCDFNVPIENGIIQDDTRIIKSLKTLTYLVKDVVLFYFHIWEELNHKMIFLIIL